MISASETDHSGTLRPWLCLGILALLVLPMPAACAFVQDEAQREAMAAAEIADHGGSMEEQMAHLDRAIELAPGRADYRET